MSRMSHYLEMSRRTMPGPWSQKDQFLQSRVARQAHHEQLTKSIAELWNTTAHSDAEITIGPIVLPIHTFVLRAQSPYFRRAFPDGVLEEQSPQLRLIPNEPHSVHTLWRALQYIYTGSYPTEACPLWSEPDHDNPLLRHIALYAAANMFLLDHLKELAVAQFSSDCNHHLGSEAASVAHFYDAVYHVFRDTSSSDSLLAATVTVITRNRTRFTKDPKFRDLLRDIPDLLSLIVQQWASEASKL